MNFEFRHKKLSPSGAFFANSLLWLIRLGIFASLLVVMYFTYRYSLNSIVHGSWALGIIVFWALTAYVTIPRIHRQLTKLYLPDYFIGRVRTIDGLLGDPVNISVLGSSRELRSTMEAAGWIEADTANLKSTLRIIHTFVFGESYPSAPMSALFLFGRRQTFAFQKQVGGNPGSRHHVRFWRTPDDWWLPGGHKADWVGAATFDKHVSLSLFTGQVTHRLAENVDTERDFVVDSLSETGQAQITTIEHFSSSWHGRSAYGDRIQTDGAMPFVDLRSSSIQAAQLIRKQKERSASTTKRSSTAKA
jgi:hypothetical protein